eukprot:s915_g11.t2
MGWWHGVEGQAKSKQLEDTPPVDPAYGDDDLGLGTGDLMHPLISLDGALIRQPQSGKGIFHGGITWDSPHWQRHRKLPKGWRMHEILNSAEFFDWVALGLAMILAYILRHYWLWQVAGEKQMASHGVSLLIWLGLGGALALAISLRFGKGHGEEWIAGYFFEFFFMLENVFVFRAVITALSLSDALVAKVLDWVVNCQIIFEAVFFLGLAHQLRALHLLPQVLGLGLLFFGLLTLRESFAKSKAESGVTSVLRSLSSSSLAGEQGFPLLQGEQAEADNGWHCAAAADFLCEIDTVLTKIEEIQSPFVAFSSSAMAAFALPELYMLSQDLLFHFPLVWHSAIDAASTDPSTGGRERTKRLQDEILVQILVEPRKGFEAFKTIADSVSSLTPEVCMLGHYSLRVAFLIFRSPEERREELEAEDLPWAYANATTILSSGWPVYGLLGLLAYKLSRDGTAATDRCTQEAESFRFRYEDATLRGGEVAVAFRDFRGRGCLLGAGLPLVGYAASVSCLGRRDPDLLGFLHSLVASYEEPLGLQAWRQVKGQARLGFGGLEIFEMLVSLSAGTTVMLLASVGIAS